MIQTKTDWQELCDRTERLYDRYRDFWVADDIELFNCSVNAVLVEAKRDQEQLEKCMEALDQIETICEDNGATFKNIEQLDEEERAKCQ